MSTETGNFGDVLGDYFDSSGGNRAPAVAWGEASKDFTVTGVLVDVTKSEQTRPGTQRGDENHILRFDDGTPRPQLEFTLQTDWRANEGISEATVEKMKTDGRLDDGLRRVFIKGSAKTEGTTAQAFAAAIKAAGITMSEVAKGATISFKMVGRHANPHGGSRIPDFAARYERPTPESLAKVAKDEDAADPWATPAAESRSFAGQTADQDPPF